MGKDADLVIWNGDPLSSYALTDQVYIDGDLYFDRSLKGYGTTHFDGVMHGGGAGGASDGDGDGGRN